jgi:ATP-dependent DNA helicase RecG
VLRDEATILAAREAAQALLDADETLASSPGLADSVLVMEASREGDFVDRS